MVKRPRRRAGTTTLERSGDEPNGAAGRLHLPGGDRQEAMLFPVLRPAHWAGLRSRARAHVWIGSPRRPSVVVAYAWHRTDQGLGYITTTSDFGRSDEVVRQAFHNLEDEVLDFEVVEANGDRMLVSAGRPLSAEQVLSQSHMLIAHEQLDAEEIVVSVTHRGLLLACRRDGTEQVRQTMATLHRESYDEATAAGDEIFDQLIVLREGAVAETFGVGRVGDEHLERWDRRSPA